MSELKFKFKKNKVSEKGAQVLLQNVRCAFVSIAKPTAFGDGDPKYEVTLLIPRGSKEIPKILAVAEEVAKTSDKFKTAAERTAAGKLVKKIHADGSLLKDGDKTVNKEGEPYDGLSGHITLKVKTGAKKLENGQWVPKVNFPVKDKMNEDIPAHQQADELYSGVWADVAVSFVGYAFGKNRGVTAYLAGIMKLKNDQRLGGSNPFEAREDVEEDMGAFPEGEDEDF